MQARPFGVSLLIAGVDNDGAHLYVNAIVSAKHDRGGCIGRCVRVWHRDVGVGCVGCRYHTDPSGAYSRYAAKAVGSGAESAQQTLQEQYNKVRWCGCPSPFADPLFLCRLSLTV